MPKAFDLQPYTANFNPLTGGTFISIQDVMAAGNPWGEVLNLMLEYLPQLIAEIPQIVLECVDILLEEIKALTGIDLTSLLTLFGPLAEALTGAAGGLPEIAAWALSIDVRTISALITLLTTGDPTDLVNALVTGFNTVTGVNLGSNDALFAPIVLALTGTAGGLSALTTWAAGLAVVGATGQQVLDAIVNLVTGSSTTGHTLTGLTTALSSIPQSMLNITSIAASLITGTLTTGNIPALPISQITSLAGYLTNLSSSGVLALAGLASGALPTGITLPGAQLTGSVAASLISGALALGNIPALPVSQTTGLAGYLTNLSSGGTYGAALPISQITSLAGYLTNLSSSGVLALAGLASGSLPVGVTLPGGQLTGSVAAALISGVLGAAQIPSLGTGWTGTVDGSKLAGTVAAALISGTLATGNIPALPISQITSLAGYLTNLSSSGVLALAGLASGSLPVGVTLPGGQLTGTVAAALISGVLTTGNIPALPITQITGLGGYLTNLSSSGVLALAGLASGALPSGITLPGGQLTGSVAAALISGVTTNEQAIADYIYQAIHGGTSTGNALTTIKSSLQAIPGSNLTGTVAAALISGVLTTGNIPSLSASQITSGTFAQAMITGLVTDLASKALGADLTALMSNLGAGTATLAAITSRFTNLNSSGAYGGALPISQITSLTGYLTNLNSSGVLALAGLASGALPAGVTLPGGQLTGSVAASLISGALTGATLAATALTTGVIPSGVTLPGPQVTGVLGTGQIPTITAAMTSGVAAIDDVVNGILSTSTTGNSAATMKTVLGAIPSLAVQPAGVGGTDIGSSIQNTVDAAVQGINADGSTGNPLSALQNALGSLAGLLGYTPAGTVPPSSVTDITNNNNNYIIQQAINYDVKHAIDPTANGPFDISLIMTSAATSQATLPTVTSGAGAAAGCFDQVPFGGIKQSVQWMGYPTSGVTINAAHVNIWLLNQSTGVESLIHASANIASTLTSITGPSTQPIWQAYNIPSGAVQTLYLGNSLGGTFTVSFSGQTTGAIAYNATDATIQTALQGLSNIGSGNILVVDDGQGYYYLSFINSMGGSTQPLFTVDGTNLVNANPTITNFILAGQGDVFHAEVEFEGTGAYNVVGLSNFVPTHPTAIPAQWGCRRTKIPPTFDAVSTGPGVCPTQSPSSYNEPITIGANATCVLVPMCVYYTAATPPTGFTVTMAGQSFTLVAPGATVESGDSGVHYLYIRNYVLLFPPGKYAGAQTVTISFAGGSGTEYIYGRAFSYNGVQSVAAASVAGVGASTGTAMSQSVTNPGGGNGTLSVETFVAWGSNTVLSAVSGNVRQIFQGSAVSPTHSSFVVTDSSSATPGFAGTINVSTAWTGLNIILNGDTPPQTQTPGAGNLAYIQYTPFISLSSVLSTGGTVKPPPKMNPVLLTYKSSQTVQNPMVTYPLANYCDVICCGGAGGGVAGVLLQGGNGAPASGWSEISLTRAQMGTSNLTITVGGGGAGSTTPGAAGAGGGASSIVIPGYGTRSASGGGGGSGAYSGNIGAPGANNPGLSWHDAHGTSHGIAGGAGGGSGQASGAQPGGGGAGGNSQSYGSYIYGGNGGAGACYLYVYQ